MITTWVFLITLSMPSFGGPVEFRGSAVDEVSCNKLRAVVAQRMEAMSSNGIISEKCYLLRRVDETPEPKK